MDIIKKNIKAIIFDLDGTILKTEHIWDNVVFDFLKEKGITEFSKEHKEMFLSLSGVGLVEACTKVKEVFSLPDTVEDILSQKISLANKHFAKRMEFIDGFENFHKKLKTAEIGTSVATNAHPDNLSKIVETMNFKQFFGENIYCISHVGNKGKPDPALFLHAAEKLGVRTDQCVVFEDSSYGFQAAKAAGMKCIAIKNHMNDKHIDQAHDAIESYADAESALKRLKF